MFFKIKGALLTSYFVHTSAICQRKSHQSRFGGCQEQTVQTGTNNFVPDNQLIYKLWAFTGT